MNPRIQQLADLLLEATQAFAAKQVPGVPVDLEGPEAKRIESMLNQLKEKLEKQLVEERASFQSQLAELNQEVAARQAKLAEVPPPPEKLEDLRAGTITFRFQEQHVPQPEAMQAVVETLLKLTRE